MYGVEAPRKPPGSPQEAPRKPPGSPQKVLKKPPDIPQDLRKPLGSPKEAAGSLK